MNDKIFRFSVAEEGDSVVQTGKVETLKSIYFGHYTEALEWLKEQCKEFVKE